MWSFFVNYLIFVTAFISKTTGLAGIVPDRNVMLYTETLKDNKDFLNLYKRGRYIPSKYSVIYVKPNGRPYNRLGITAGKKIGNAVHRNRAKRIIRLAYRESEVALPVGIDIVIVARSPICEIKSDVFRDYMKKYGVKEIEKIVRKTQK